MFPFASAAISKLNKAGLPVIVVTNQSGISRRIFPESLVSQIHARISQELSAAGARVDGYYYCAHTSQDDCSCRKPLPGLLEQAAREHGLCLAGSFVVGDRYADVELAHGVGARGVLVLTGYGRGEYELHRREWPRQPDSVAEDLSEAVDAILEELS
jgi:D-glycero-D-manno-heptose 1,7-bisphosphate phosphatase